MRGSRCVPRGARPDDRRGDAKNTPLRRHLADELNRPLRTVIVAPLTSVERWAPYRVDSTVGGKRGQIALDQMRAVDKSRLVKRVGRLDDPAAGRVVRTLLELFA